MRSRLSRVTRASFRKTTPAATIPMPSQGERAKAIGRSCFGPPILGTKEKRGTNETLSEFARCLVRFFHRPEGQTPAPEVTAAELPAHRAVDLGRAPRACVVNANDESGSLGRTHRQRTEENVQPPQGATPAARLLAEPAGEPGDIP
jgi:hypothetical protein